MRCLLSFQKQEKLQNARSQVALITRIDIEPPGVYRSGVFKYGKPFMEVQLGYRFRKSQILAARETSVMYQNLPPSL